VFYRAYPLYTAPQTLAIVGSERLVQLWIANAYSLDALGIFYFARQIFVSPILALTAPIGQLVFSHLSRMREQSEHRNFVVPFFETAAAAAGLMVGFGVFLGAKFAAAADYTPGLVLGTAMLIVIGWAERSFDVSRRPDLAFVMNLLHSLFIAIAILIAYVLGFEMTGFVFAWGIAGFLGYLLFTLALMQTLGFSPPETGKTGLFLVGGFLGCNVIAALVLRAMPGLGGAILAGTGAILIGAALAIYLWRKL
jgi:Polysaccharide biosynthesis protein